jgi:thioredoxin 1
MKGDFNEIINSSKPTLVDFYADWCGPCKAQSPILKEVSHEAGDRVRIIKIDVDKNNLVASKYQIRGVPTLILFKNGQPVWRQSGVANKQQLMNLIAQNV